MKLFSGFLTQVVLGALTFSIALSSSHISAASATPKQDLKSDVRLLIDISGSMKQNDPNDLRIPALKLVTNLMPKGSEAGVWAFGRYVNMLVPIKEVDARWQDDANLAADKINSAGLFTNIGDAIAKSSWDWNSPSSDESRSLILLTDGMVDISKDANVNNKERERILNDLLPRLKNAGVTIHTIALSQDADKELLETLATQTDGWFRAVNNAEELQKVFLKIFEQATPRDSLPIDNNQFKVDASIEEMTLLVFRAANSKPTKLISPGGNVVEQSSVASNLRWFSSSAYDLVTIENPEAGDWQIDAAIDPDNRVMVVSKLSLAVNDLPNNVLAEEQIQYAVQLLEDGEVINRPDFLDLVDSRLETRYQGNDNLTPLLKDSSGTFQQIFYAGKNDGVLEIKLLVESPTFQRSRTHAINIYGYPVQTDLEMSFVETVPHKVHLRVTKDVVDLDTLRLTGQINYPDETNQFIAVDDWSQDQFLELKSFPKGGEYKVTLNVEGRSPTGRSFKTKLPEVSFNADPMPGHEPEPVADEPVVEKPVEDVVEQVESEPTIEEPKEEVKPEEPQQEEPQQEELPPEPTNWTLWLGIGLAGNLFLVLLGWLGWRFYKKRAQNKNAELASELIDENTDEENKDGETN